MGYQANVEPGKVARTNLTPAMRGVGPNLGTPTAVSRTIGGRGTDIIAKAPAKARPGGVKSPVGKRRAKGVKSKSRG